MNGGMTISEYLKTDEFKAGSKPTRATVINRIENKDIAGKKKGGLWYVYPDENIEDQILNSIIEQFEK